LSVRTSRRSLIVPIFIPHQGCPHKCIYCQQEKITGQSGVPIKTLRITEILDMAIKSPRFPSSIEREVAFFGGSFTSLGIRRMTELLKAVEPYLTKGFFNSIRVSTRPDGINAERLELMRAYGVRTVELGVQSMDNEVLRLSKRGHTAAHTKESAELLNRYGFRMGVQLMPGLPGDSEEMFLQTVRKVMELQPAMARLYPAVVIAGTELADWYKNKKYRPLTLEEAIRICGESCILLEDRGIPVIRMGLMSSPSLLKKGTILAGPWHSAFGFLVRSWIHQKAIEPFLPGPGESSNIGIRAPFREIPLVRGYKNQGIEWMEKRTGAKVEYVRRDDFVRDGRIGVDLL
jgi:histone acetyltransferase (RNA polymerase elongator complex component)